MFKNSLYPYIEKYINEYLHGFTSEQLQVGIMSGTMELENLNLRPDKVNKKLDDKNQSFWLKAGLISKISVVASIMNIIGEKPLNVIIDGVDVILTPSYKWINKNLYSFVIENKIRIKEPYDEKENNSFDIFQKKVNIFDNSIFVKEKLLEIFKDKSKISNMINKMFKKFFKFYYSKNFSVNAKIKNIHIRFEDDQLINYIGDIALGFRIDLIEITLSSDGIMKRNNFQLQKFDLYWESKAKILIPSDTLNNGLDEEGNLEESYYTMLKKLNFGKFSYLKDTQFIVKDFNCKGNFGTQSLDKGNIDLFNSREKNFRMYIQFASSELNINLYPDLFIIFNNFKKFIREFSVLEQVQDFKPMKKPYDKKSPIVKEMLDYTEKNKNSQLTQIFLFKKKMLVRDWLYYFYWCKKCNSSIYGKTINPLRLEFSRFYNLCFNNIELNNSIDLKKEKDKASISTLGNVNNNTNNQMSKATDDNPNPDNINLSFLGEFLIKGININLNITRKNDNNNSINDYVTFKLLGMDIKLNISKEKFIFNFGIKNIGFGPSKLLIGEKVQISNPNNRRYTVNTTNNNLNKNNNNTIIQSKRNSFNIKNNESEVSKLIKKYNPQYEQSQKVINETFNKILTPNNQTTKNEINNNTNNSNLLRSKKPMNNINNTNLKIPISKERNSFISSYLNGNDNKNHEYEIKQFTKDKTNFQISQAINSFTSNKIINRPPSTQKLKSKGISIKTEGGPKIQLNLLEINSDTQNNSFNIQFIKPNDNKPDILKINLGIIRFNLFPEYVSSSLSIISEYKNYMNQPQMKSPIKITSGLKLQRQLFTMKKYIYNYLINLSNDKKNNQIKQYIEYLKNEIDYAEKLMGDNVNFEINYLFSLFSKGIEINFDYENFECVYYNNDKGKIDILGKALLPQIDFNFKLTNSLIYVKFFDFEFEINDLTNTKLFLNTLMKITEEKLKSVKIFIEPCLIQIKAENEKKNDKKNNNNKLNNYDTFRVIGNENDNKGKIIEDKRGITKTLQENESMENGVNFINKDEENINGLGIKL